MIMPPLSSEADGNRTSAKAADAEVLFVTRKWAPAIGGMETYSVKLVEALSQTAPVDVVALPGRPDGRPPAALALAAFPLRLLAHWLWRSRQPDVLHLGDIAIWPLGLLANRKCRLVISAHGTDVSYYRRGGWRGWLYERYLRLGSRLLRRAQVIANSHATADVAAETGWRTGPVVPLATEITAPPPDGAHDGAILFVGRLVEGKGCAWFIRNVLPILPEKLTLKVVGTGWDKTEMAALENPRVEFIGPLRGQALVEAFRAAMCVIVPNITPRSGAFEGFGLVAPEAASAGAIVLASDHGGLRDAVIDGETGVLVETGNAQAWAQAICHVAAWDLAQRRDFANHAQERARAFYSWPRVARQTRAVYEMSVGP